MTKKENSVKKSAVEHLDNDKFDCQSLQWLKGRSKSTVLWFKLRREQPVVMSP